MESNLPWGRYNSVRAVDELSVEARIVVVGQSVGAKRSSFHRRHWLVDL